MAVRQADSGTYAMPPSYPRDAPDVRKSRLLALAGGGALILVCALVMCLLRVENHGNVDWNAALEMSLLSAGLTGALSLGAYAINLRSLFIRQKSLEDDLLRREAEYRAPAPYDALTGLPNRSLLTDRVRRAIAEGARNGNRFGFMIVGLEHLKEVNDSLGHGAGDALLCEAALRLQLQMRPCDTVARLGGDEFAVLLPGARGLDDIGLIAPRLIDALTTPYLLGGHEVIVSACIGIALYPNDAVAVDDLFRFAGSALHHAKRAGRNNVRFYETELAARSSERLELAAALHKAVRGGELELYYQPQIDLRDGTVAGVEALLRWHRPGHGMVAPDKFIPVAEESGLIVEIGEWVLDAACRRAAAWNRTLERPVAVSVNVSTRQFMRHDFVATVERVLAASGCRPAWVKLEITESLLLEDNEEVARTLGRLYALGLVMSIDDFGTGYSALGYLHRFPVSQIKIDRSFVSGIPHDGNKSELVKAILSIAAALRLQVIAEGVETQAQVDYLLAHGCWFVQGYLSGVPMPAPALDAVLHAECRMTAHASAPAIMEFPQSGTTMSIKA